ncbi:MULTISPECIES: hypothetical protein [Klebsiella pneumoniae complex]|nr:MULTISPECIES: hypothetical protein [Klebsiella]
MPQNLLSVALLTPLPGYFFERGSRVVNDGDRQGLQQFLIGSS